jgi:hypothetical protein
MLILAIFKSIVLEVHAFINELRPKSEAGRIDRLLLDSALRYDVTFIGRSNIN